MFYVNQQTSAVEEISAKQWLLYCGANEPLQSMIVAVQHHGQKYTTPGGNLLAVGGGQEGSGFS